MSYELAYDPDKEIIYGRLYGYIDADVIMQVAIELAQLIVRHECYRFLNDAREATLTQSMRDVTLMPDIMAIAGVHMQCKRAFVVREVSTETDFLQGIADISGHNLRVFTDIDEANEWLMQG